MKAALVIARNADTRGNLFQGETGVGMRFDIPECAIDGIHRSSRYLGATTVYESLRFSPWGHLIAIAHLSGKGDTKS